MIKYLKKLPNNDTLINERICLIIDNTIFLLNHHDKYNFPGGKVSSSLLNKKVGMNSVKELEEEMGIIIPDNLYNNIKILSWHNDEKCKDFKILVFLFVKSDWIKFKRAHNVWEIRDFTLFPMRDNQISILINNIGTNIEKKIQLSNMPCANCFKLTNDGKIILLNDIEFKGDNNYIYKDSYDNIYVKLTNKYELNNNEKLLLIEVNSRINGYHDDKYLYTDDYTCKMKYIPFSKDMKMRMSDKLIRNKNFDVYNSNMSYMDFLKIIETGSIHNLKKSNDTKIGKYLQNILLKKLHFPKNHCDI